MEMIFVKSNPKAAVNVRFVKGSEGGFKGKTLKVKIPDLPKPFALRLAGAEAYRRLKAIGAGSAYVKKPYFLSWEDWYTYVYEGFKLASYEYTRFVKRRGELTVYWQGEENRTTERVDVMVEATNFARDLVNTPPNIATPSYLKEIAEDIAERNGYELKVYGRKDLEAMGMNAFLAVAAGSSKEPYLVHLVHRPKRGKRRIALVGKAITFDSGGLSLKTSQGMLTMKMDKAGACVILAVFHVLKRLGTDYEIHGIFATTENMPDGGAYRPGDVVKSYSGKTVEILNTDAEGRLTLADALAYASDRQPDYLIDLATLTGSSIVALGEFTAALFSNDFPLEKALREAAYRSGERLWPMPLEDPFIREKLSSQIADLKNISGDRWGGAIFAAQFLSEFVKEGVRWAHIDIAGPSFNTREWGYNPAGATGFGVRTLLNLLAADLP